MAEPGKDTRYRVVLGVGVGALVLDQLTKLWVMASLPYYGAVTVIPGFFDLVNIRNRGAAFGFLNRSDIEWQFWLFFAATLVSAGVIFMLARSAQRGEKLLFWGLAWCSAEPWATLWTASGSVPLWIFWISMSASGIGPRLTWRTSPSVAARCSFASACG